MAKKARKRATSTVVEQDRPMSPSTTTTAPSNTSSSSPAAAAAAVGVAEGADPAAALKKNEVRFGKHLASSDKRVRDRTVFALREWLQQRSKGGALTDLDLLKIWRGLWYCMFMCDKAPIQRELAQNLAGLVNLFKNDREQGVRFFRSFCITMQRDWERIDNLRIDKYYTLVRMFLREVLLFCRIPDPPAAAAAKPNASSSPTPAGRKNKNKKRKSSSSAEKEEAVESCEASSGAAAGAGGGWDLGLLEAMSDVMEDEIVTLHPAPIGLRLHLADVWVDEALAAGGEDMPTEAFLVALAPWLRAAAAPDTNAVVFKRTFEGVFEGLLGCFAEKTEAGGEGGMEVEEEEGEEEKKVFRKVDLSRVQACLFEVAGAPQTRQKRRTQLYELHRRYQQRTGVAPDANAPPSGFLPLPSSDESSSDSDSDAEQGEYDGEYVEAGQRPRAVRGLEPPVAGWVAAGIAAGEIGGGGGGEEGEGEGEGTKKKKKKKRRRSGSLDDAGAGEEGLGDGGGGGVDGAAEPVEATQEKEEEEEPKRKKKKRKSTEPTVAVEDSTEGQSTDGASDDTSSATKKKKHKKRKSVDKEGEAAAEAAAAATAAAAAAAAAAETAAAAAAAGKRAGASPSGRSKKRKIEAVEENSGENGAGRGDGEGADAAGGSANANGSGGGEQLASPPSSGKHKKKKKRRSSAGNSVSGTESDADAAAAAVAAALEASEGAASAGVAKGSPGKRSKRAKGGEVGEGAAVEVGTPSGGEAEATKEASPSSSQKKKKKKRGKSAASPLDGDASPASPVEHASSEMMAPPAPFRTPPKKGKRGVGSSGKKSAPDTGDSARKTVTFGVNMAKEHTASVKDLKTRVITPAKDAGTPQKGLLKVGGGGSITKPTRPAAGRKDTPHNKRAAHFF